MKEKNIFIYIIKTYFYTVYKYNCKFPIAVKVKIKVKEIQTGP